MGKRQFCKAICTTSLFSLGMLTSLIQPSDATAVNIVCKTNASTPTIIATAVKQSYAKDVMIFSFLPQYFTPQSAIQICQNTAKNLQIIYSKDDARYFTADNLNGQSVVCVVERRGIGCTHDSAQVLFTFRSTANPAQALYEMLGNSFKQAQPVGTRTVSRIYSDIKPRKSFWWLFMIGSNRSIRPLTSHTSSLLSGFVSHLA
jgi:hypothetical protein